MMSEEQIREQINHVLEGTDFPKLGKKYKGKVRDNYSKGAQMVMITTDRVSAFDYVLGTIPFKGQILTQMALFWFDKTKDIISNHIISNPDPNVMIVKKCKPIPVEMVVRGYITGVTSTSAWFNYSNGVRNFCGNPLPEGLKKDQKFDAPIITPTTKAEQDDHDRSISRDEILAAGLVDEDVYDKMEEISLKLYNAGVEWAAKQGLIFVDTKYEFGLLDGELMLMDEINTPDSSRYWVAETYQELFDAGQEQQKLDKEFVRKWLKDEGYSGEGQPPALNDEVKIKAAQKYMKAYEMITGKEFKASVGPVAERIEKNLKGNGYL